MNVIAKLNEPYSQEEYINFVIQYNRKLGCVIDFGEDGLVALKETDEELAKKEKERIAKLKMTPRDFLLAIVDMGVDYSKIKELMSSNSRVEIELQYCNNVYRGNPLLNQLCGNFGVTTEQLDELFKAKGS
nr:MAG TPA: 33 kDa chaperonin [Caudoviricetes sp.]